MLRKSILPSQPLYLNANEQKKCLCIANFVLFQCFLVIAVGSTIIYCIWRPDLIAFDPYKLASIMYLYDKGACETDSRHQIKTVQNLKFSSNNRGFNVLPIRWEPAVVTVSSRLSHNTRNYVKVCMVFHVIWAILTIPFRWIVKSNKNTRLLNIAISVYFFIFIFITMFDLSMAIVYITHIKKALTKGMIVRHSGWSVELKILSNDDFAGYLPMIAASYWMRGHVMLALNIYSCKIINDIRFRIKKKLVMTRLNFLSQRQLPEPMEKKNLESRTLYYRAGENKPYIVNNSFL